ncbi:MAG: hypothetical protein RLZZ623_1184 [Actinomycetota bacterium]
MVGAGFAGLAAATALQQFGYDVAVVEARDRVGGKVEAVSDASGRPIDVGGQFVNDDMHHVLGLIAAQGKRLLTSGEPSPDEGCDGQVFAAPRASGEHLAELRRGFTWADATFSAVLEIADLPAGSNITLGTWLDSLGHHAMALAAIRSSLAGVMCMSVDDIPLAHVIDLARRTPLTRGELQYVVAETLHGVAVDLASQLRRPVFLSCDARAISVADRRVTIRARSVTIEARHALIAVPPTAYRTMSFQPALPAEVTRAATAFRAGSVMKFLIGYDHAFWRRPDVGSVSQWLDPAGLYVRDASLADDRSMLVAFVGGPTADAWRHLSVAHRRTALLDCLIAAYGNEANTPRMFLERDWAPDEWGAGGYWNVLVDPSIADAAAILLRGVPGITFASTELASVFPGYVEGAIDSGVAAADTVRSLLGE